MPAFDACCSPAPARGRFGLFLDLQLRFHHFADANRNLLQHNCKPSRNDMSVLSTLGSIIIDFFAASITPYNRTAGSRISGFTEIGPGRERTCESKMVTFDPASDAARSAG